MADDETLDQEIEPTPFLSKALIGRFLAVGVFVALGTFAVLQSVSGKKDAVDDHADHDHALIAENAEANTAGKKLSQRNQPIENWAGRIPQRR